MTTTKINKIVIILAVLFLPFFVSAQVVITEVMCNPATDSAEWVKITNTGTDAVNVQEYRFFDNSYKKITASSGDFLLNTNQSAFIISQKATSTISSLSGTVYTVSSTGLNNGGERIGFGTEFVTYAKQTNKGTLCTIEARDSTATEATSTSTTPTQTQVNLITKEVTKYDTVTIEPPQDIYLRLSVPKVANTGTAVRFSAEVYDAIGKALDTADIEWSFGDGSTTRGTDVRHRYNYAGTYVVSAYVRSGVLTDEVAMQLKVTEADVSVRLDDEYRFVEVINNSDTRLDLSGWALRSGYKYFYIPERTFVLPDASIRFSIDIIKLNTLQREGHVLLIDSARTVMGDSREYVKEQEIEQQDANTQASSTQASSTEAFAVQPVAPPVSQAGAPPSVYVPSPPAQEPESSQRSNGVKATHRQVATVATVVNTKKVNFFDSGVEWFLGLFSIVGFGVLALKSFSFADNNKEKSEQDKNKDESMEFEIKEIK